MLKWNPELIKKGLKIISIKMEHFLFLECVSFLPWELRKLPEGFGLHTTKSWYPNYFNTEENLNYVEPMPDISYYGVDEMSRGERKKFLARYETRNCQLFHNKHVLEAYCQDELTILKACRVFRREFYISELSRCFSNL